MYIYIHISVVCGFYKSTYKRGAPPCMCVCIPSNGKVYHCRSSASAAMERDMECKICVICAMSADVMYVDTKIHAHRHRS